MALLAEAPLKANVLPGSRPSRIKRPTAALLSKPDGELPLSAPAQVFTTRLLARSKFVKVVLWKLAYVGSRGRLNPLPIQKFLFVFISGQPAVIVPSRSEE